MSVWPNGTYTIPRVSSEFGPRKSPGGIGSTNHLGIDLTGIGAIKAAVNGTVIFAAYNGGSGNEVRIKGDDGKEYRYKHNSVIHVRVGARVAEGQHIANEGATGAVTGKHSHFEVLVGGRQVNPRTQIGPPSAAAGTPVSGNFDPNVLAQQVYLNARFNAGLAPDGRRGPRTKAATAAYQRILGVVPDGNWGPKTQAAHQVFWDREHPVAPPAPAPASTSVLSNGGRPPIARGAKGPLVGHLQRILKEKYPAYAGRLVIDNDFGGNTFNAVKEFQRRAGLVQDGVVGRNTWNALGQ